MTLLAADMQCQQLAKLIPKLNKPSLYLLLYRLYPARLLCEN